jgi:hypothetical protein
VEIAVGVMIYGVCCWFSAIGDVGYMLELRLGIGGCVGAIADVG